MNIHRYNVPEVLAVLDQIVADKPDEYTYFDDPKAARVSDRDDSWDCVYVHPDGCPACLIGHVFARLGVPVDLSYNREPITDLIEPMGLLELFTDSALDLMYEAQVAQDGGNSWEEAVDRARARYGSGI